MGLRNVLRTSMRRWPVSWSIHSGQRPSKLISLVSTAPTWNSALWIHSWPTFNPSHWELRSLRRVQVAIGGTFTIWLPRFHVLLVQCVRLAAAGETLHNGSIRRATSAGFSCGHLRRLWGIRRYIRTRQINSVLSSAVARLNAKGGPANYSLLSRNYSMAITRSGLPN